MAPPHLIPSISISPPYSNHPLGEIAPYSACRQQKLVLYNSLGLTHVQADTHLPSHTCMHFPSHTRTLCFTHTFLHTQIHSPSHALTLVHTHAHSLSHTHTPFYKLSFTHTHTLLHSHAHVPHSRTFNTCTHLHTCSHSTACSQTHIYKTTEQQLRTSDAYYKSFYNAAKKWI